MRLAEQHVAGVVSLEYVEEQSARGLKLSCSFPRARKPGEYETGNARDFPELPSRHFCCIQRRGNVLYEIRRIEQPIVQRLVERRFIRRQQLESVVVGRHRKRYRLDPGDAIREKRSEP